LIRDELESVASDIFDQKSAAGCAVDHFSEFGNRPKGEYIGPQRLPITAARSGLDLKG